MKKIIPIIDLLKNTFPEEVDQLIDLTFSMIYQVCISYPKLFEMNYFKHIIKDFFEIEPFKNLFTISKLITEKKLKIHKYFTDYLAKIFTRYFETMMQIYNDDIKEI